MTLRPSLRGGGRGDVWKCLRRVVVVGGGGVAGWGQDEGRQLTGIQGREAPRLARRLLSVLEDE